MSHKGDIVEIGDRRIFVVRGIFDYFDKKNFTRLKEEYETKAKYERKIGEKVGFYVALYSDNIIEKAGHTRRLKGYVEDNDRVSMLEALNFVDGAFIIDSPKTKNVEQALKAKLFDQENEVKISEPMEKKYKIGYASGAFSNLHKGHIEHLKEMSKQCQTVIVAANSDRLITEYKHKKVTVDEETRKDILSHIKYVDMAIITNDYDKLKAIERVKDLCGDSFDAIFVGSDWKGSASWKDFEKKLGKMGIDVVFTDRPENGISTTKIDKTKIVKEER